MSKQMLLPLIALLVVLLYPEHSPLWGAPLSPHQIQINGILVNVKIKGPAIPLSLEPRASKGAVKWVVKFTAPVRPEQREAVEKLGCRLHDYLPEFAFLATMDEATKDAVAQLPFIDGVARFEPAYKLQNKLRAEAAKATAGGTVRIQLKLDDPVHVPGVIGMVQRLGGEVLEVGVDTLGVRVKGGGVADIAGLEEVLWIDEHIDMHLFNDTSRWVIQSNVPGDTRIWDKGIHGEGQIVGIGDTGVDYDMPWFRDPGGVDIGPGHRKIVGYDTTYGDDYDADYPGHGTHVAGTVGGDRTPVDGVSTGNGMAPKSRYFIQDICPGSDSYVYPPNDLGLLFATAYQAGTRIHTNSWGSSAKSYGVPSSSADRFLWDHKDLLALFANGNTGPGTGTVGNPANAKNVLSVGAGYNGSSDEDLASFSSNGPTADGRIKPTVTAPGVGIVSANSDGIKNSYNSGTVSMSGTSMATPTVAGAAALVRQYFTGGYHHTGAPTPAAALNPSSALLKAVLINSAQSMTGAYTDGPIPSTGQGWGRINLGKVLLFQETGRTLEVAEEQVGLATGETWSRGFQVTAGQPFKVTLVWTDYPGATGAAKALVNDLDLSVVAPDGTVFSGNAFAGGVSAAGGSADRLNVEEQVLVAAPVTGSYTVSVTGYNVPYGPQPFALAVTGDMGVSPRGTVALDRPRYRSDATVNVRLSDRDLNLNPTAADKATVRILTTTDPTGAALTLTETSGSSGIFTGGFALTQARVRNGDTITVRYDDADDGTGKAVTTTATAIVDDIPPVIAAAAVKGVTDTSATVTWTSDEPATSSVAYGTTPAMGDVVTSSGLATEHVVTVPNLMEGALYYLSLQSVDAAGNVAATPATVTTMSFPPSLTVTSSEGTTTYQASTIISGVSNDPSGVTSLVINGTSVERRASDGFFSLSTNLALGDNVFAVAATDSLGNKALASITVARLAPPDLYLQGVTAPSSALQGGKVTVTDTICNKGAGAAAPGSLVGFYLSTDTSLSSNDVLIGSRTQGSLGPGACSNGSTVVTIPPGLGGGTYYLIGFADYTNRQVESDEGNNVVAGTAITLPDAVLAPPSSLTVPGSNSTGSVYVYWGSSNVSGATYKLECSKDGGPWSTLYTGPSTNATVTFAANGNYSFRVSAAKTGYTDSACTTSGVCVISLACGAPVSITVPSSSSTGSIYVYWGSGNVSGASYVLEYSRDGGAWSLAYSGIATKTTFQGAGNGTYTFRVKATKAGYADSPYRTSTPCAVSLACATPTSIIVPSSNSTGKIYIYWGSSNVTGATYILEYSKDGGAWSSAYSGTATNTTFQCAGNGTYTFRVKATKAGYAESPYKTSGPCAVSLACGAPTSITVPPTNSTGSIYVYWGSSDVSGATYLLEYSKDGGPWILAYAGSATNTVVKVPFSGSYLFHVKATKPGYADSPWKQSGPVTVTF